jgi:hypothetical protein
MKQLSDKSANNPEISGSSPAPAKKTPPPKGGNGDGKVKE